MNVKIKQQICNISESLLRNITDNFKNVSFTILEDGNIQVLVILKNITEIEKELITDFSGELEAAQESDLVEIIEYCLAGEKELLDYIVYSSK